MGRPILICLLFIYSIPAFGQKKIEEYVRENATKIININPDSADYSDLEIIGNAIGDSRIVMLGEQDHGDAPAFLAKTRLIKYLHEKKGFNVLAFESDFFGLNEGWERLIKTKDSINAFLSKNIFPIWTWCDACVPLFYNYVPATWQTGHPLIISGFDSQQLLSYTSKNLSRQLDSLLRSLQLPVTNLPEYSTEIFHVFDTISKSYRLPVGDSSFMKRKEYLKIIRQQLSERLPMNDFWLLVVDNLIASNMQYSMSRKEYRESTNIRDQQMSRNLQWLTNVKFRNEKIIVWAHNYHISKYAGHYPHKVANYITTMGTFFTIDTVLMKNTYVLGFTSYKGTAGRLSTKKYEVEKPDKDGFENWIDQSWEYAFTDFKKFNLSENDKPIRFSMKGSTIQMHKNEKAAWNRIFDGVFYIRDMYPCIQIEKDRY